jgi:hypothetical protein
MSQERDSGILPPEQEATFENASNEGATPPPVSRPFLPGTVNEESGEDNNSALGNASNVVEVPPSGLNAVSETNASLAVLNSAAPTATGKTKRAQTVAQKKTMQNQAAERQALKDAGVAKPSVAMVATLASMKAKGDSRYESAFANAVSGKALGSYRPEKTAKAPKAKKGNTVLNTTLGLTSSTPAATNFMAASPAANARANSGMAKNAMQGIEEMGASACDTIRKMVAASKTLCKELAKTNNSAGLTRALNGLAGLPPLPLSSNATKKKRRMPKKKNAAQTSLSTIPEASEENTTFGTLP